VFDEAGMTLPPAALTPGQIALQKYGYQDPYVSRDTDCDLSEPTTAETDMSSDLPQSILSLPHGTKLQIKLLSPHATLPTRATEGAVGYDLYSATDIIILPNERELIPLDIAFTPPVGCFAQILSRSGLSIKHRIDVTAGTIDPDYTGNVMVSLHNSGTAPYQICIGDCIAQMVLMSHKTPVLETTSILHSTEHGAQGFGSTGTSTPTNGSYSTRHPGQSGYRCYYSGSYPYNAVGFH
jgi:dUTP pyrophosphatase